MTDWNTPVVWGSEVLASADLNANFENVSFLLTQVLMPTSQGRLTLESGVPISTTDQTAKTTLYFTPLSGHGNLLGLYDSADSLWSLYSFSEISLSLSGYIVGAVYDIFAYLSGGSPALESLIWKTVAATNNPSAGSSVVINMTDTGDLAVGREVTVKDGSNSEICRVTAVVSNTSITVATLVNSYTTPDIYGFNTRATALTLNSGIWVKTGDATRRYLGTIRITPTAGQCEDSTTRRYVWNMHNRRPRRLKAVDTTDSWVGTGAWRTANGSTTYGVALVGLVIGINDDMLKAFSHYVMSVATNNNIYMGFSLDTITTNVCDIWGTTFQQYGSIATHHEFYPGIGAHYIASMERTPSSVTVYGDQGAILQSGMVITVLA